MTKRRKHDPVTTDFPFPPPVLGTWRPLTEGQRQRWLIAACNRHFKWLRRRGPRDAPAGTVFRIEGADVDNLPGLLCALGEAVNGPGGYFGGLNALSLQDCLFGSFGVTLPFAIHITNVETARRNLGGGALATWAQRRLRAEDFLDAEGEQWLRDAERSGREGTATLLDTILDVLRDHGVSIEGP